MNKIADAIEYSKSFIGRPYKWGGETPMGGYDCSGFVQEIIRSVGLDPRGDQNSQALYNYFNIHGGRTRPQAGALAFYGKSRMQIIHVAFCINDYQVIEAGGGGRKTVDIQSAIDHRAFVRIRPVEHRKDLLDCFMPDYSQD